MEFLGGIRRILRDPTPRISDAEMLLATAQANPVPTPKAIVGPTYDPWGPPALATSAPLVPAPQQVQDDDSEKQRLLAPPSVVDRYPIQIGQNLTGAYLSSAYRLCTQGWRYQFVDLINELLEFDPHARGVTRQRTLGVPGGRIEVHKAHLPKNDPDDAKAQEIAEAFNQQLQNIPRLKQSLSHLNWAVIYGVSGCEIIWDRSSKSTWDIVGLSNIHSRRLNYPNPMSWDLSIYDQGMVGPGFQFGPTNRLYGLRVADYPGKFIIHTPSLNGDYPTRDGEARYIGLYMLLKRMIVRSTAQDFERNIRPWAVGYFNRRLETGQERSIAGKEDIVTLERAIKALGMGQMNAATLPDSVRVELLKAVSALNATEFISFLNREMSKGVLGQAFTTEPGANGNLSTSMMADAITLRVVRYDAGSMSDTLEQDLGLPWMRLNYPGVDRRLLPRISIVVDEDPDPTKVTEIAKAMTAMDAPVDIDKLSEINGIPLVAKDDMDARRSRVVAAGKGPTPTNADEDIATDDPNEGGEETIDDGTDPKGAANIAAAAKAKKAEAAKTAGKPKAKAKPKPTDEEPTG